MYKQYYGIYGVLCDTAIIRTTDGACIPFDPQNVDYQEYLKWVSEGNQPISADE